MLLSFHVKRTDLIQCYLYLGGEIIRFEGYHLKSILPIFFEQSEKNMEYVNSEELRKIVNYIDHCKLLNDSLFEKLYNQQKITGWLITKDIENKMITLGRIPLQKFTTADICSFIENWVYNDIEYKRHLKEIQSIFVKNELNGM
eukprot:146207_1